MQYKRLSEIATSVQYGYTAQETSQQGVYKYLRITDIVPYYPNFETVPYCAIDNDEAQKYLLSEGDIVIARTGATTGYNFVVTKKIPPTVFASYLIRFRVDETQAYPKYIKYVLKSKPYYGFVANYVGGSAQPGMGAKVFARFPVPLPPLPTQRAIAEKLGRYDALIENNARRIAILEAKAEQLYKEWFVRKRGAGKVTFTSLLLFDVANISYGYPFRSDQFCSDETLNPVVRIRDIQDNSTATFTSEQCDDKYLIEKNAILVGMDGLFHMCLWNGQRAYLNQRVVKIVSKSASLCNYLLFLLIAPHIEYFEKTITGTTVAHLGDKHLRKIKIEIPDDKALDRINQPFERLMELKWNLKRQNALLAKERDLLLPRLMSGRLSCAAHESAPFQEETLP